MGGTCAENKIAICFNMTTHVEFIMNISFSIVCCGLSKLCQIMPYTQAPVPTVDTCKRPVCCNNINCMLYTCVSHVFVVRMYCKHDLNYKKRCGPWYICLSTKVVNIYHKVSIPKHKTFDDPSMLETLVTSICLCSGCQFDKCPPMGVIAISFASLINKT